jgi:hypothetical protein
VATVLDLERRMAPWVAVDALALLGERAALLGLTRAGDRSCGGGARLLRATDGWIAAALARPEDLELLPAWLGVDAATAADDPVWSAVEAAVAVRSAEDVVGSGIELGLPVGVVDAEGPVGVATETLGDTPTLAIADAVVVDLSSLWAGPLAASLFATAGADVIKVESARRPDGARRGDPAFFDLLNAGKRSVALDFGSGDGRRQLRALLERADIVIEGSRPRALEQLGIDARGLLAGGHLKVWLSITGHGRDAATRVGFGDDAAATGGLVVWEDDRPRFCADALADPLTGLAGAISTLEALGDPGSVLVDVGMSAVARAAAGPTLPVPADAVTIAPPWARAATGRGPALGADTDDVLAEMGIT